MTQTEANPCEGCSWCCEYNVVPLINDERVINFHRMWGNEIFISPRNGRPFSVIYNPCQHLGKDGWCTNYENRVHQCRNFPTGFDFIYAPHCALMRERFEEPKLKEK